CKIGGSALSEVVDYRAQQEWSALQPVFPILQELPNHETIPILDKLLDHEQLIIRREALRVVWEIDDRLESVERYLRLALRDDDLRIEMAAIQRLAQLDTPQSLYLLHAYIEGRLSGRLRPVYHCRRAAEALINRGEAGVNRLCRVLRSFSKNPFKVRWAKLIAGILKTQADDDYIRKSLRIWKFSPAGLTYLFLKTGKILLWRPKRARSSR
ncbi:HEAT repeat domain-containing protein, partial [Planctomycetota bacterium]